MLVKVQLKQQYKENTNKTRKTLVDSCMHYLSLPTTQLPLVM